MVDFIVRYIGFVLGFLVYSVNFRENMWCYFGWQLNFVMMVKYLYYIVVGNFMFLCIYRVDLYFLTVGSFQEINIVVG